MKKLLYISMVGIFHSVMAAGTDTIDSSTIQTAGMAENLNLSDVLDTTQDKTVAEVLSGTGDMSKSHNSTKTKPGGKLREDSSIVLQPAPVSQGRISSVGLVKPMDEFFTDTAAPVKRVIIKFSSNPTGAELSIDDGVHYHTPYSKALPIGKHILELSKPGYTTKHDTFVVQQNGQHIDLKLTQLQTRLTVDAINAITGEDLIADVYISGAQLGQTPLDVLVPVGTQQIVARTDSMQGWLVADLKLNVINHATIRLSPTLLQRDTAGNSDICNGKTTLGAGGSPMKIATRGKINPPKPSDVELGGEAGSRPPESIRRVIRANIGGFRLTYEKYLKQNPNIGGKISLKFTISPSGDILSISVASSNTGNSELDDEIKDKARCMKFDPIEKGNVTVTYAFTFNND